VAGTAEETGLSDDLLVRVEGGIAHVTFNRPKARNALTFAMYDRLEEFCAEAGRDKDLRAVILTGAGGEAFAAGTDIGQFRAFATPEDALAYEERIDRVVDALERCPVPTIAALAGACTGAGTSIAAACDLRIAAANLRFGIPIARTLGNCLSLANYARLAFLIGAAHAKDILFTARLVAAEEARAIGLVSEILPDAAALAARAEELARLLASHAPLTLRATKEALLRVRPRIAKGEGDDLVLLCYMSADFREGMTAFLEKRAPRFQGK
jgi:enoyl-CoA hydratase